MCWPLKRTQTLFSWFTIGTSVLPFADMAWWAQTVRVIRKKKNYILQKRVVTCKKKTAVNKVCKLLLSTLIFTAGWTMTQYFIMSVYVYLPTLTHYGWVSRLWTKDIDLRHQGQFLMPDTQIQTNCSLNTWLIMKIPFNFHKDIPKRHWKMSLCPNEIKTHLGLTLSFLK